METQEPDEQTMVHSAVADVGARFPTIDTADVEETVRAEVHRLSTRARVKSFVPILAARSARDRLAQQVA